MDKASIIEFLKAIKAENYEIDDNLSVNFKGDFKLVGIREKIPFKIGKVNGNFIARRLFLKNCNNFPDYVKENVDISGNDFVTLSDFKTLFGGSLLVNNCSKLSLLNIAQDKINADLDISHCNFTSIDSLPSIINGNLLASGNKIVTLMLNNKTIKVLGNCDFSSNKIQNEEMSIECINTIDISDNPINPDDNLKELATWS
jgi:hypothetical protein